MIELSEVKNEEVKEQKEFSPFDYVTIPVKEYRKMIRKIEKLKAQLMESERVIKLTEESKNHYAWYKEEKSKAEELRTNLDDAKAQISKMLGVNELEQVRIYQKGQSNAEQS